MKASWKVYSRQGMTDQSESLIIGDLVNCEERLSEPRQWKEQIDKYLLFFPDNMETII